MKFSLNVCKLGIMLMGTKIKLDVFEKLLTKIKLEVFEQLLEKTLNIKRNRNTCNNFGDTNM